MQKKHFLFFYTCLIGTFFCWNTLQAAPKPTNEKNKVSFLGFKPEDVYGYTATVQNVNTNQDDTSLSPKDLAELAEQVDDLETTLRLDAAAATIKKREQEPAPKQTAVETPPVERIQESTVAAPPQSTMPPTPAQTSLTKAPEKAIPNSQRTILMNFTNANMEELIRYLSSFTKKNFIYDAADLQFSVTIVSYEPTTLENAMAAILQELRIHGLNLIEEGNNIIIHRASKVHSLSTVIIDAENRNKGDSGIITELFRLNTLDAEKVAALIRPLISEKAFIEVLTETNYVIVTDLAANVDKVGQLIKTIDKPNSGLVIGQYVIRNSVLDVLVSHAEAVMTPLAQGQTIIFVPHYSSNSIFIVSSPFLVSRSMTLMQYLDQNQGMTRIFDEEISPLPKLQGTWRLDAFGNWVFYPQQVPGQPAGAPPNGRWELDPQGNWHFVPGEASNQPASEGPKGNWVQDGDGNWVFQMKPGGLISPNRVRLPTKASAELPLGHIERTQFSIFKLHYRQGDEIQLALARIGESLALASAQNNADLIAAIESVQWLEASNSLILTGTGEAIAKLQEFIGEIDLPLRQVFIEMLVLDTSIEDSLDYSVNFGTRLRENGLFAAEGFLSNNAPTALTLGLDQSQLATTIAKPDPGVLAKTIGFNLGIVGQHITHGGLQFNSIGALIKAIRNKTSVNVVMNPKILTEDNYPAEVFIGLNTQFPTQAIVNDQGVILTQNFEYRNVGTYLKVTPLIGDNDVITLLIEQDISSIVTNVAGTNPGAITTRLNTTKTKVHLPDKYFLILSGMIQDEDTLHKIQVPCLGAIPYVGALFKDRSHRDSKRNLMIFIRPQIVDTIQDIQSLTRHQQDVFILKNRGKADWKYESEQALDWMNLNGAFDCDGCPDPCAEDFDNPYMQ